MLYLNGERQDEPYVVFKGDQVGRTGELSRATTSARGRSPMGTIFCIGDNRDNSLDSRFWGPVPLSYVKGRAVLIYWSYEAERDDWEWQRRALPDPAARRGVRPLLHEDPLGPDVPAHPLNGRKTALW